MKTHVLLAIIVLLSTSFLSGCTAKTTNTPATNKTQTLMTKLLVNELALKERPFTLLIPHITNKLFTFVTIGANKASSASVDLEYQSGDLLKGARTSIDSPIPNTFVKAIILGSCSTGGKCTFDTDLRSGTEKLKLTFPGEDVTHILKGDFVFLTGQKNMPDGKVSFEPSKLILKENLMMFNSLGLPKPIADEILLYPIVISATSNKLITGNLTINQPGVASASIYDGKDYQPLKISQTDGLATISINHKPWSLDAEIVRDDQKGSKESVTLFLVGPIVLSK